MAAFCACISTPPPPSPSPNCKVAARGPLWGEQLLRNLGKGKGGGEPPAAGAKYKAPRPPHKLLPEQLAPQEALSLPPAKDFQQLLDPCITNWLLGLVA